MESRPADTFTVALIYIKPLELRAITVMLDERYDSVTLAHGDHNDYILGRTGNHNVVVVGPARGDQGTVASAQFVGSIRLTFPNLTIGLVVGIGGGIPHYPEHDVRLGDVVVGAPEDGPAVVQYDLGKRTNDGFEQTRVLSKPPRTILQVVNKVEDKLESQREREEDPLKAHLARFLEFSRLRQDYQKPAASDLLFKPDYAHEPDSQCAEHPREMEQLRHLRDLDSPFIHHSTILSGNTLMRSSEERDRLSKKHNNALCFEMEAAGLMDVFPCLVIRGICDYADSHKTEQWQKYAAAAAAAYARELLMNLSKQAPRVLEHPSSSKAAEALAPTTGSFVFSRSKNYGNLVHTNTGSMVNTFGGR